MVDDGLKVLSCAFWDNVPCSYRKNVKFGVMSRCYKCSEYERFQRAMEKVDEEEARFLEEVEKHPERYSSGELR